MLKKSNFAPKFTDKYRTLVPLQNMLDKLEAIKAKFDDIGVALTNPDVVNNNKKYEQLSKEYRSLEKIVIAYGEYKRLLSDLEFNREALMGDDEELRELAKTETAELEQRKDSIEKQHCKAG